MNVMVEKNLTTEMFVIYEENAGYRMSQMKDGVTTRGVTPDLNMADMFKSVNSALDHVIFTLHDQRISSENTLKVHPVRVDQKVITNFSVGDPLYQIKEN